MARELKRLTAEKLNEIRNHPYFATWRKNVIEAAEKYLTEEPPRIKYSKMHSYYVTGHRTDYRDQGVYVTRMITFFNAV